MVQFIDAKSSFDATATIHYFAMTREPMTREVAVISVPGHDAYTVTILDYPVADPDDVTHSDDIDFPDLESALSFAKLQ